MKIKKASPGLDQRNRLGRTLGDGFIVEDYDPARPLSAQVGDAEVSLSGSIGTPEHQTEIQVKEFSDQRQQLKTDPK